MTILEEAKEIMGKLGCEKVFAIYKLKLNEITIADIKSRNNKCEAVEIERDLNNLASSIVNEFVLDEEKPIECPLNNSMSKYLEFNLKNKEIIPFNIHDGEVNRIEKIINPVITKYKWTMKNH